MASGSRMSDRKYKEIVTDITPKTIFWTVIALVLETQLLPTGFPYI